MPIRTIECAQCGHTLRTRFSRQKLCELCAILRDQAWGIRPRPCADCGKVIHPIRSTYKLCDECHIGSEPRDHEWPTCTLCGVARRTPPAVSTVCLHCVQESKETRARYTASVRQIVRRRRTTEPPS